MILLIEMTGRQFDRGGFMIRNEKEYNQIKLFIRYVIGRKSPVKLINYIKEELQFHDRMDMAITPDGITLKVTGPFGDNFVPLGHADDPTCIVYLSIIGAALFATSHSTYIKRIDFVKYLRLKDKKPLKPELAVIIPNMAPYIKRLNERIGYRAILNKKIGREAGYFFENKHFRGNMLVPYHMDKRKFSSGWSKGDKIIYCTAPDCSSDIIKLLNDNKLWVITVYSEKEIKTFQKKYGTKFMLIDSNRINEKDISVIKNMNIPYRFFEIKENNSLELWNENTTVNLEDINKLPELIGKLIKSEKEKI